MIVIEAEPYFRVLMSNLVMSGFGQILRAAQKLELNKSQEALNADTGLGLFAVFFVTGLQ